MPGFDVNYESLNDFHRTLSAAFFGALKGEQTNEWSRVSSKFGSGSTRNIYPFIGELPKMREWVGPRIARQISNHKYSLDNRKFELTFKVKRDELEDDFGGAIAMYSDLAGINARAVATHPDELMMGEVLVNGDSVNCYDGQYFFDTDHPVAGASVSNDMGGSGVAWYLMCTNAALRPLIYQTRTAPEFVSINQRDETHVFEHDEYMYGSRVRDAGGYGLWQAAIKSKQTLSVANIQAAMLRMQSFTNDEGKNLGLRPNLLVTPRGQIQFDAAKILTSEYLSVTGGSTENNVMRGTLEHMISNYLPIT
jgi:phage major head subunit gpT-like protein